MPGGGAASHPCLTPSNTHPGGDSVVDNEMQRLSVPRLAAFLLVYLAGAGFAKWLAIVPGTGNSVWPPGGVYLAALLLVPRAQWPWWIGVALVAELGANALWFHNPVPAALAIHAGNLACAVVGAMLVARASGNGWRGRSQVGAPPMRLEGLRGVLALAVGAALAPCLSATAGAATLNLVESQPFLRAWALWWIGDATGILLLAPPVLVLAQDWRRVPRPTTAQWAEAALLAALLLGVAALSLGGRLPFAYIVMPPLLWAAVRFEFRGAVLTTLMLAAMSALFTTRGVSPFSGDALTQGHKQVMLQLFLAISAVSSLVVAALARQHRMALRTLRAANEDLELRVSARTAALARSERRFRAMADAVPVCLWVTDVEGRVEFVNRAYERFYGVAEAQARGAEWQTAPVAS